MMRSLCGTLATLIVCSAGWAQAQRASGVFSFEELRGHGLTKAWMTQATIDRNRDDVRSLTVAGNNLYLQSREGVLQAIDAETGQNLWRVSIGTRGYPTLAPGATARHVAVTNGSRLFLLDATNGHEIWQRNLPHAPSAPPAVDAERVYLPLMDSKLLVYRIDVEPQLPKGSNLDDRQRADRRLALEQPWFVRTRGEPAAAPVVTPEDVAWTTVRGHLYVAKNDEAKLRIEIRTGNKLHAAPTYRKPLFYVGSADHVLYAVHERRGRIEWRFMTEGPIVEPPVALGDDLFVTARGSGMTCVDPATGQARWFAPGVARFVAASPTRVVALDDSNELHMLHRQTGHRLDRIPTAGLSLVALNLVNDRIYIGRPSGLVQCLHEESLPQPVAHEVPSTEPAPAEPAPADEPADAEPATAEPPLEDAPAGDEPAEEAADSASSAPA